MAAGQVALEQLADQDYPLDRIVEVIVLGADVLTSTAPLSLRSVLRDFHPGEGDETPGLCKELEHLTGDVVAIWGDDHVSAAHRLRLQVSAALSERAVSVLRPKWFFDPEMYDFRRINEWPTKEFSQEISSAAIAEGKEGQVDASFAELMVTADPLTIVGTHEMLSKAAKKVEQKGSPSEELKQLLLGVPKAKIIDVLQWVAVRPPPMATKYEAATPENNLVELTQKAWPKGGTKGKSSSLDALLTEIEESKMAPAAAILKLLSEDPAKPRKEAELRRIHKVVQGRMTKATGPQVIEVLQTLSSWFGIQVGQGDAHALRLFPTYFAIFTGVRDQIGKTVDFFDMSTLGTLAEGLVRLAMKIWATDPRVNDVLAKLLAQEIYMKQATKASADKPMVFADFAGTLGLREPLTAIAYAALDLPRDKFPPSGLASLAWALAEAKVENASLQIKVAKGIIAEVDKLAPPDIGKLWVAMDERRWFKDAASMAYLTQTLLARVQELKRDDPGISKMVEDAKARKLPNAAPGVPAQEQTGPGAAASTCLGGSAVRPQPLSWDSTPERPCSTAA